QLEPQLGQQALEPGIVPAGLHPHPHFLPGQRTIKLFGLGPVAQPSFFISSRLIVKDRDLLKSRMKITAYNQHDVGSFSESLGFFRSYHRTRRDRANVVMQSSAARNLRPPERLSNDNTPRCTRNDKLKDNDKFY